MQLWENCAAMDIGVDVLGVRRADAAPRTAYDTDSLDKARAMLRCPVRRRAGRRRLLDDRFAPPLHPAAVSGHTGAVLAGLAVRLGRRRVGAQCGWDGGV